MQAARLFRHTTRLRPTGHRSFVCKDIYPKTTMNDLPSPQGNWQANYDKNQQRYNRDLILGTATLAATLAFGQYMGYHRLYNDIPEEPLKIDTYKVEE